MAGNKIMEVKAIVMSKCQIALYREHKGACEQGVLCAMANKAQAGIKE